MTDSPTDVVSTAPRAYQGTRPGGRSARVREAVLGATLAELLDAGYADLSYPRIAERAGVALSTVHRRWPEKAALVSEALADVTAARVPVPDTGTARGDLLALASSVAAMLAEPATIQVLRSAFALPDADLRVLRDAHWEPRLAVAATVVDRAIARGELPAGTTGWSVVEPIHARIWMRALITGLPLGEDYIARCVDLSLAAAQRGETVS